MKKFVFKILVSIPIVFLVLFLINHAYFPSKQEGWASVGLTDYNYYSRILQTKSDTTISLVGASHGEQGFNFNDFESKGISCANFAGSSQTWSYDYKVLSNYSSYLAEGGIMFITVSIFSPYFFEEKLEGFSDKNKRYHTFLNPVNIKQYKVRDALEVKFPVISQQEKLFTKKDIVVENNDEPNQRTTTKEDALRDGNEAAKRHSDIIKKKNPKELSALYNMVELCKKKNITPILITPPFLNEYTQSIDKKYWDRLYKDVEKISKTTKIPYYDYSRDNRFIGKYDYFMNSDHLNREGARIFTNYVMEEIPEAKKLLEK